MSTRKLSGRCLNISRRRQSSCAWHKFYPNSCWKHSSVRVPIRVLHHQRSPSCLSYGDYKGYITQYRLLLFKYLYENHADRHTQRGAVSSFCFHGDQNCCLLGIIFALIICYIVGFEELLCVFAATTGIKLLICCCYYRLGQLRSI